MKQQSLTVVVNCNKITNAMGIIMLGLLAAHVAGRVLRFGFGHDYVGGFVPLFNLNEEHNFPTLYAFLTLIFSSLLLLVIGFISKLQKRALSVYWIALSAIFAMLAFDEVLELHERLDKPIRSLLHTSGIFYYAWTVPYMVVLAIVGVAYLRFLVALPKEFSRGIIVAAVIFVGGALGVEFVTALVAQRVGVMNVLYLSLTTCEEFLEMLGILLFIRALLRYIEHLQTDFTIRLSSVAATKQMV